MKAQKRVQRSFQCRYQLEEVCQEYQTFEGHTWFPDTLTPRNSKLTKMPSGLISTYNKMQLERENLGGWGVLSVLIQFQRIQNNLSKSYRVIKEIALRKTLQMIPTSQIQTGVAEPCFKMTKICQCPRYTFICRESHLRILRKCSHLLSST